VNRVKCVNAKMDGETEFGQRAYIVFEAVPQASAKRSL
jgi:hypothetical protein